jgi:hypothetical protein
MKINHNWLLITILFTGICVSCSQKAGKQQPAESDTQLDEFSAKLRNINPGLKDPARVAALLDLAGADYIPGLINPHENVDQYAGDPDLAALNLGVYAVDIGYLVTYEKREEALVTYERARKLASTIGFQSAFELGAFERYKEMAIHPDTLLKNLTISSENLDKEMTSGEKQRYHALYVTGEFFEKIYIATQVVKQYPTDLPEDVRRLLLREIIIVIAQQETALDELIGILSNFVKAERGQKFLTDLNALKTIYKEADFQEYVKNFQPGDEATNRGYLTQITDKVEQIRNEIISAGK